MTANALLDRRDVVARLVRDRAGLIAISSLGSATYDLAAAGDHPRNFYLWGAMGGAADVGLGLALAQPEVPVMVLTGDGETLMGMGAFATIALQAPRNLSVVILDNGLYGETGSQTSQTAAGTDLAAVAAACGIRETLKASTPAEVDAIATRINRVGEGPFVATIAIAGGEKTRCLPSRDGAWLKARLRRELGLETM
jgi:thiamine pyrophosphate-dependent acetolactate synthase large subunit-like protein